jgi:hypothetical protein
MDLATRKMVYYGLLGLLIAGSTIAVFREAPNVLPTIPILAKDGTLSIYFKNIASGISSYQAMTSLAQLSSSLPVISLASNALGFNIVSLDVTIDSVMVHRSGTSDSDWIQISHTSTTIDLMKTSSVSVLIASGMIPEENVTMIQLHLSNATATVSGPLGLLGAKIVVVSGDNLKIQLDSGAMVKAQMSTSVEVVDHPHIVIEGNGTIRLTPVLNVDSVKGPE